MRYYVRFVMFVDGVIATCVALEWILRAFPDPWGLGASFQRALRDLTGGESMGPYLALAGTVVLILNAVAFSRRVFGLTRTKDLSVSEGDGDVRIRTSAVEDLLARVCEANPIVAQAKVRVFSQLGGRYRIVCSLAITDSPEFHRTLEHLRTRLRERFLQILPQAAGVAVQADVTEMRPQARTLDESTFAGPQYPVGDEFFQPPTRQTAKKK